MWDETKVERYERWFATPAGRYAFHMEHRLLDQLLSSWPRRCQKLLEIGCGPGFFLQAFWEGGFQVTGIDSSPAMLESARKRLGDRVDLHLGHAEHLPFDDKEFDFAVILTVLEFCPDPVQVLREARRVARQGLVIAFLNPFSLYYLTTGLPWPGKKGMLRQAHWYTLFDMRKLLRQAYGTNRACAASVLPGPMSTWRNAPPWKWLNGLVYPCTYWPLPLGAYIGLRVEFGNERIMTPLLAFKQGAEPCS